MTRPYSSVRFSALRVLRPALACLLTLFLPTLARAATLNVPSQYPTIQAGVNASVDGDTVLVADGTYSGPGNRDIDFNGKSLTVMSQHGAASTVIDCGGYASTDGSGNHRGFYIHSGELTATISGFTVKNGYETYVSGIADSGEGGGVYNANSGGIITLTNCTIIGNSATNGGGVKNFNEGGGTITLTACTVSGNTAQYDGNGGGIYNENYNYGDEGAVTNRIMLINCTISGNTVAGSSDGRDGVGGGIHNDNFNYINNSGATNTITLTNCTVFGNAAFRGGGVYNGGTKNATINLANDIIYRNSGGEVANYTYVNDEDLSNAFANYCDIQGGYPGTGNINANPLFVNAAYGGLHLKAGSPCLGAGTHIGAPATDLDGKLRPNPPSMGAYEKVSLTYDAGYYASHVDLSDKNISAVSQSDLTNLAADTAICSGAVADGATKVLLRYNADLPGAVTFTATNRVSGDTFRQVNKTNVPTSVATQVINGKNVAFALYTVPESLDSTTEAQANPNHFTQHTVSFQVVFTPTGGQAASPITQTLVLESPPVLLIHGLWSDSSTWLNQTGTLQNLNAAGYTTKPDAVNQNVFLVNYKGTNNRAFELNRFIPLLEGIKPIYDSYRARQLAVTKVDVVGHSMGGLLTREFANQKPYYSELNFQQGYIRRMITIGTPHNGTPIASVLTQIVNGPHGDAAKELLNLCGSPYGDAVRDLQPGSPALTLLKQQPIPCFAEAGWYNANVLPGDGLQALMYLLKFKGYNISSTFNGQNNDVLVGEFSAYGGLDFSYYNVALNTDHLQETASSEIGQDVVRLVTGPLDNFYQPGFPAPVVSSSALVRTPHWVPSAQSTLPTAPFVSITAPTAGQVFQPGDTLTVTATPNAGTTLTQVLIYAGSSQQAVGSTLLSAGPFTASFTIPNNYLGDLPITVLAQDSNGNICNVTIHAVVQTTATLSSMTVAAGATAPSGAALLTSQGSTTPLTVTGTFSDATQADITASALGTACISSDPAVATVSAEGILTAQADGNCTITVTNGTVTATKNVIVQLGTPTILSVTPASGTAGTTVSLALVGSDLGGASKIEFYLNGTPDPNITATTLQATPQGDGLTAAVTLAPGAVAGLRTVVVITPGGPSDILAAPDAAGFTVIPASSGGSHVLWTNTNGTASLWNYAVAGGTFTQNTYGPYPGWSAKAVADGGTDGKTRVLWTNTDGTISLWSLDSASGSFTHHEFGPYPGWTASAVSVGPDNTTHLLWTNTDGTASLWNYSTDSGTFTQNAYGPYSGWSAKAVADGGTDGKTRLLWTNTDGTMSLWSLDNTAGSFTQNTFGPYPGWTASAVSVAPDNTTHIVWNKTDGTASVWNYSTATGGFTQNSYGPYPGWSAGPVADTAGKTALLWTNTDGTASIWDLDNASGVFSQYSFGPYGGWSAIGLSAAP